MLGHIYPDDLSPEQTESTVGASPLVKMPFCTTFPHPFWHFIVPKADYFWDLDRISYVSF